VLLAGQYHVSNDPHLSATVSLPCIGLWVPRNAHPESLYHCCVLPKLMGPFFNYFKLCKQCSWNGISMLTALNQTPRHQLLLEWAASGSILLVPGIPGIKQRHSC
jgi:hypothetical protein